jgi:hypothetical protein
MDGCLLDEYPSIGNPDYNIAQHHDIVQHHDALELGERYACHMKAHAIICLSQNVCMICRTWKNHIPGHMSSFPQA